MKSVRYLPLVLALALGLSGCGSKSEDAAVGAVSPVAESASPATDGASPVAAKAASGAPDRFEDYDDDQTVAVADPLEPWNRFWFGFNDIFILRIVKPVYTGYVAVTPVELRSGLTNLLHTIQAPVRIVNRLLQGEVSMAGVEFGRFVVNATVGFGGLINVAAKDKPLRPFDEQGATFDRTLAVWGAGEGFYLVWPFFGPSTARGTVGLVGDYAASPFFWGSRQFDVAGFWVATASESTLKFNNLGGLIDAYESLTKMAVEPYTAVREAYIMYQRSGMNTAPVW